MSKFSFIIWGWKADPLKFKDKFKDGASSVIFIFWFSFVAIVFVTNFGFIMFKFLFVFLPPFSLFKRKKLFAIWEFFSSWVTLKGKLALCSGIGAINLFSVWNGCRNVSTSSGFFDSGWVFWEFINILVGFIFDWII